MSYPGAPADPGPAHGTPGVAPADLVRWSLNLPEADDGQLVVAPDGVIVVSSRRFLATVRPDGVAGWLTDPRLGLLDPPVILAGGRIARPEDGRLVTRDLATGATVAGAAVPRLSGLTAGPDGDLLYAAFSPAGPVLVRASVDGAPRWSQPLAGEAPGTVALTGTTVVAADGATLRGYDSASGAALWSADRDGFGAAGSAAGQVHGELTVLPDGRLVAGLSEPAGHGLYLVDPAARTVTRISPPVTLRRPLAVRAGSPPDLIGLGPRAEVERGRWQWSVVAAGLDGALRWTHPVPAQPVGLLTDVAGRAYVVCSPSLSRFHEYHGWYDLSGECFVRCLGPAGEQVWTWPAPVPLTYRPAIGADGTVYVAAPGRLWALRAEPGTGGTPWAG